MSSAPTGRLASRRALVTGAARGIGAAIARTFAAEGAAVAVLDVDADGAKAVAAEVGGPAVVADLRSPVQTRDAVAAAVDALGGLDVLVNDAGIFTVAPLLDITVEAWDATFEVNVRSMLLTTQAAVPAMVAAGGGRIVNLASMGGKVGEPGQAAYAASKAAVIALTRVAAMELGPSGITVNCLCPGYVLTELAAHARTDERVAAWTARSPLGRLGQPEDVARAALFLVSDDSAYCTGQALNVTGGMVFH